MDELEKALLWAEGLIKTIEYQRCFFPKSVPEETADLADNVKVLRDAVIEKNHKEVVKKALKEKDSHE